MVNHPLVTSGEVAMAGIANIKRDKVSNPQTNGVTLRNLRIKIRYALENMKTDFIQQVSIYRRK